MRNSVPISGANRLSRIGVEIFIFNSLDHSVEIIYLLVVVVLALRFSGRRKSLKEYFHASGTINWWAVAMSDLALPTAGSAFQEAIGFEAEWCIVIIAASGMAYTVLGGMREVIWSDVAQGPVFILGYGPILLTPVHLFHWQSQEILSRLSRKRFPAIRLNGYNKANTEGGKSLGNTGWIQTG